ncbi:unnamed protein product [Parascedosporium putredinis]|uniref:RING-type domain-containing protein n=1 Tax=Parascedosporium putredinis TaxID=1442378 RepID=A0A9P1ME20_9PEZI|nr:unnamed protein product [Parascedosporium putredinis]CAI8003787.1 unnamed protein product [Parascedosporium putredinis]
MSHSKRNTTRPVFTAHERALARAAWTSSSARLTRDSFLPFGSCNLCLEPARDPVSCHRGDVFCRECALANLLAQKRRSSGPKAHPPFLLDPSLTPTIDPETALSSRKKPKDSPICPCSPSDAPHILSQKHLVTVLFTEEKDPSSSLARAVKRICPCCRKTLSNPSKPVLAKPCGHVLCRACAVRLVESARADADTQGGEGEEGVLTCYVCDVDLSERKKDMKKKNKSGAEDGTEDVVDVDPAPAPAGKKAKLQLPATLIELRSDALIIHWAIYLVFYL